MCVGVAERSGQPVGASLCIFNRPSSRRSKGGAFTLKENQPELLREAERLVRVVKTVRLDNQRRIEKKVEVTRESSNFYATNFQLGQGRWRIDTEVFQTITVAAISSIPPSTKALRWWCSP